MATSSSNAHSVKRKDYLVVLYPESEGHMRTLEYLKRNKAQFKIAYILHDSDVWSDEEEVKEAQERWDALPDDAKQQQERPALGNLKKLHYHVFVRCREAITEGNFKKCMGLKHVAIPESVDMALKYFLHDTPSSWDKHPYLPDALKGDSELVKMVDGDAVYDGLRQAIDLSRAGWTYTDYVEEACSDDAKRLVLESKGSILKEVFSEQRQLQIGAIKSAKEDKFRESLLEALRGR